jgi:uncharacterized protein YgiM (DUF1202 family)
MKKICFTFLVLAFSSSTPAFSFQERTNEILQESFRRVKEKFAPDKRTAVFDISWEQNGSSLVLKGEADNASAKAELIRAFQESSAITVVDSIRLLPDPSLGDKTFGIVSLSVGNVRSKPGNPEELATQVLMGMVVKLLKKESGYYLVQSSDSYLGWLDSDALFLANRGTVNDWVSGPKVIATGLFTIVREKPDANGQPVCDLVAGGILKTVDAKDLWVRVELPDGRKGYVDRAYVEDYESWKASRKLTGENIEKSAKSLMGIPYLWGGTSVKGMDCSGFTKTVFRMNGMELNRDANQQALMGEDLNPGDGFQNLRKGDLLFFGRKASSERRESISHVAVYLENKSFIHTPSGRGVRFGSFDPASSFYDEANLKRFVRARRIIPATATPEVRKNN